MVKILKIKDLKEKIMSIVSFKDVLMIVGLIMFGKGIYMIYPPATWIIVGGFIIFLGWPSNKVVK